MRTSEDRYENEQQQIVVALRFLEHEARTQTVQTWTGLTQDRIRKLYNTYLISSGSPAVRHRGKSPHQTAYFWRTARIRQETVWLASLFLVVGLIENEAGPSERPERPDLRRAELLCQAFDSYRAMVSSARISFEHAIFLAKVLERGEQIRLGTCPECGSLVIIDPISIRQPRCDQCSRNR